MASSKIGTVSVIIASLGRRDAIRLLLERLKMQTVPPAEIIISLESQEDCPRYSDLELPVKTIFGPRGSSVQRNRGIDRASKSTEFIVFLDDDYVPSKYFIEGLLKGFEAFPEASGLGGLLLADGARGPGIPPEAAIAAVDARDASHVAKPPSRIRGTSGVYGCNMAFRHSDVDQVRFDEHLPLYGWLEDSDFGARLPGKMIYTDAFFGVHCGIKRGKENAGNRFGYSQIANPIYLWRKGTLSLIRMVDLIARPLLANIVKSHRPEPWIDRRGRLAGNLTAIKDLAHGRISPQRILEL